MNKELLKKEILTALMTSLYVVLSLLVNIPIINKIRLELGYVVLGVCTSFMNCWQLMFVGGVGVILRCMFSGADFPLGWLPAQLVLCFLLSKIKGLKKMWQKIAAIVIIDLLTIGLLKTVIECALFKFIFWEKLTSNLVACLSDGIGLLIGVIISDRVVRK